MTQTVANLQEALDELVSKVSADMPPELRKIRDKYKPVIEAGYSTTCIPVTLQVDSDGNIPYVGSSSHYAAGVTLTIWFEIISPSGTYSSITIQTKADGDVESSRTWNNVEADILTSKQNFGTSTWYNTYLTVQGVAGTQHANQTITANLYYSY